MPETVLIVAGETSGELYGALLAGELKKKKPAIRIVGVGGERMKAAGVELIAGISSAFGFTEALSSVKVLKETFRTVTAAFVQRRPSVVVLIDYPDFNLRLAAEARKQHIPVLYYVSPQVWAWRRNRVKKIAALVDRMAVILPFEEQIYRDTGLEAEFVGHPILDEIGPEAGEKKQLKTELGLDPDLPLLALLPGSRPHELQRLLPLLLETVRQAAQHLPGHQFCMPFAPNTDLIQHKAMIDALQQEGVRINKGKSLQTLAAADYGVIASGTATLQAVLLGLPLVVVYKVFPLTYWLGRKIVNVKHISLVNILSNRAVVRELLQREARADNILDELKRIRGDQSYREAMQQAYASVKAMFSGRHASERVAEIVLAMSGSERR